MERLPGFHKFEEYHKMPINKTLTNLHGGSSVKSLECLYKSRPCQRLSHYHTSKIKRRNIMKQFITFLIVIISFPIIGRGQETGMPPMAKNLNEIKFVAFPGLPTCTTSYVQSGDPTSGPCII